MGSAAVCLFHHQAPRPRGHPKQLIYLGFSILWKALSRRKNWHI